MNTQRFDSNHLRTAGSLLTLALVLLFALLSVLIVAIGIQAYDQIVQNAETNARFRTSLSYTANKIRVYDGLGMIEATREGDIDTLALHETIDGDEYVTYIYCYNGMLYEWFTAAGTAFDPLQGEALLLMESFQAVVDANGIWQTFTDPDGMRYTQYTALFAEQP